MDVLVSIFKTIESIKKKYPAFKIKVDSVHLYYTNYEIDELLSTYNVAELKVNNEDNEMIKEEVPECIERLFIKRVNYFELNFLRKLRELHIDADHVCDFFKILRYLQDTLFQEQFKCLTLYLR